MNSKPTVERWRGRALLAVLMSAASLPALAPAAAANNAAATGTHTAMSTAAPSGQRLCAAYSGVPAGFGPARNGVPNRAGMIRIPAGRFQMGSNDGYPEERNVRTVRLDSFLIDEHEVTNEEFARFVKATGYVTDAERARDPAQFPGVPKAQLVPGSVVFVWPKGTEQFDDAYRWWKFQPGANWRHPFGPGSSIAGKDNHPVVQVTYDDAKAYAKWLGRDLPTEAEYEYAARGGLDGDTYPWGNTPTVQGRYMANTWQGDFPAKNLVRDGYKGTAPVGCFAPNAYGMFDPVGNVWQWTKDAYEDRHPKDEAANPLVVTVSQPVDTLGRPARVIKGGSFLCAPNFCVRYRPSSRQPQDPTLGTVHIGFRTVLRAS
ncbi:formylglycine-generating enzyme family protein [Paraburkholderia susongensis]|uniref:Formylglycine-generating enzyme, required for sulfatase activity, contains SUMF1/FGE domain n=1 Tax=Paraburkholderia susongensis TaxID=1515439 RepID=A0A1X7LWX2_9BURK|nr:formylglycine-generating enzyme family protein [Paraburkholderia susongensis]SMG57782.1 Formylglycine-generating enzyme, required for sulfatase activity, contains SUMF1/FGE domain [Paraburkholderia susongensis]